MFIMPSVKKSLVVEQFQGNYLKVPIDRDMKTWLTVYFFDIGYSCYDQLTPVKTRYLLTSITWPYRGSSLQLIEVMRFFEVDRWPSAGFLIGSRAHVRLTYWKQDRIVRKPVNASPGLKFIRIITYKTQIKILPFPSWVSPCKELRF